MIWLRRAIAIPLAVLFIILALLVLLAFRVNATLGNPDFYAEQLQKADMYQFIYDDVLPSALAEYEMGEDGGDFSIIISPLRPHIVDMVRQTLPPEWLQAQVEHAVNELVPYVWGEKNTFVINVQLKDRVEAGAEAIKNLLHQEDVFPVLYGQLIQLVTGEIASAEDGMPAMLGTSEAEMEAMLRTVLPEDWLLVQLESAIDEMVPYLTKETEHVTLEIDLTEPLNKLEGVLIAFLSKPETYDSLFVDMLLPALQENSGEVIELPLGMELTGDEVVAAARGMLTLEWYQELVQDMVGQIFAYLRGEQDDLELVINLAERKSEISEALIQLADEKIESAFDDLPACSWGHLRELLSDPSLENIMCRPMDMSYQEFKELVGIDVGGLVQPLIELGIPDEWVITESDMASLFGGEGEENMLVQARELIERGLIFTEADLMELAGDDATALEDIRQQIADGLVFTEQDFKNLMSDAGEQMAAFEQVRSSLGTAKKWINFIWIAPFLLLIAFGTLCARRWSSKLIWAAALLAMMAIIAYIIFGPVYSATAQPMIDQAITMDFGQSEGMTSLLAEKGIALARNAIDFFVSGLRNQSLGLIIASVLLVGAGTVWYNWHRIRRT